MMDFSSSSSSSASLPPPSSSVVVDSLLCFLHNFRHLPCLSQLLRQHFAPQSMAHSLQLLIQLCPDPADLLPSSSSSSSSSSDHPLPNEDDTDQLLRSVLFRFDRILASSDHPPPVFAASDLLSLPLRPVSSSSAAEEIQGQQQQFGEELRHIRLLLQQLIWRKEVGSSLPHPLPAAAAPPPLHHHLHPFPPLPPMFFPSSSFHISQQSTISSSPEYPPTRPAPPRTPNDSLATIPTISSATNNNNGMSPWKGRGRLDHVVEKLRQGRTTNSRKEAEEKKPEAEEEGGRRRGRKEERGRTTDDEGGGKKDDESKEEEASGGNDNEGGGGKGEEPPVARQQKQQQHSVAGVQQPVATAMASSYAMQMLRHLVNSAGGFGAPGQCQQQRTQTETMMLGEEAKDEDKERRDNVLLLANPGSEFNTLSEPDDQQPMEEEEGDGTESPILSSEGSARTTMTTPKEEAGEEKSFWCDWPNCQKRFGNKFLLKKHQFIHTNKKPHKCPFCAKQFNRKDNLLRHKKTHLQNGLAERGGIKRRHNMLYGVTAEEALLSGMLPLGTPSRQQRKKTTQEGKEGERKGKAEEGQR